jgi:thiamine-monophosphate kinase
MGEQLSDIGEFGLIRRLLARVPVEGEGVVAGPGDDAAVVAVGDRALVATADLLVEGRHFDRRFSSAADIGFKALTVNVSDIAAMGGRPRWALLSIGAPADEPVGSLEELYDGIAEAARASGVVVIGGDTVAADSLIVSVAVLGEPGEGGVVMRSGAHEGDLLGVTGAIGGAAAGLTLLRAAERDSDARALLERFPNLARAHRRARARIWEGMAAAASGAHAMIDVSDGLAQDVGHIAEASGTGVVLEPADVPLEPGVAEASAWGAPSALTGGDDYELAIAVAPHDLDGLREALAPTPFTVIGRFGAEQRSEMPAGWDSFRGPA